MYYSKLHKYDTVNGTGFRVSIWVSGCRNYCEGCFSKETWDFEFGQKYTSETENSIISYLEKSYVSGLTLLGGEIMEKENVNTLINLVKKVKDTYKEKSIWAWSGYTFEEILLDSDKLELLKYCDVLVDGKFMIDKKDLNLSFRGSSNQRIIDVKKSLKLGEVVLFEC